MSNLKTPLREALSSRIQPSAGGVESLDSLQILRGVAAWCVVFHHYMQGFHDFDYSSPVGHFFSVAGKFGVDIFFVISGFIMSWTLAHRQYTSWEFLSRRLLRIAPAYWFMTLIFLIVIQVFPSSFTSRFDWNVASLAQSLLFIPHQNPSGLGHFPLLTVGWTLNFEMFFYVWLSVVLWVFRKNWLAACTITLFVLPSAWAESAPYAAILSSNLLYEFAIGMLICPLYLRVRESEFWTGALPGGIFLFAGACIYWSVFAHEPMFDFRDTPILWRLGDVTVHLSAAMFVCAALAYERHFGRLPGLRLFRHLGDISYSTYLTHPIALCVGYYFLGRPTSGTDEISALGAYTALTLLLSHLGYRWIETGPGIDFLKRTLLAKRHRIIAVETRAP